MPAPSESPNGCLFCGVDERTHGLRIDGPERGGTHRYTRPDTARILARMRLRRGERP